MVWVGTNKTRKDYMIEWTPPDMTSAELNWKNLYHAAFTVAFRPPGHTANKGIELKPHYTIERQRIAKEILWSFAFMVSSFEFGISLTFADREGNNDFST